MHKKRFNHYTGIVCQGQLEPFTGSRPDILTSTQAGMLKGRLSLLRSQGKTAYAVAIKEIDIDAVMAANKPTLADLELRMYEEQLTALTAEYDYFLARNSLPELSADELILEACAEPHTTYLSDFIQRWEKVERDFSTAKRVKQ